MPILDVEIVLDPHNPLPENLAQTIANAAGEFFGSLPGQTWVKVKELEADHYAENGMQDQSLFPVFVRVLKADHPEAGLLAVEAQKLTQSVANACARPPENVHIIYLPPGAGRVAFGGKLVK